MNLTQLRAFDAVAREGSFSKAATLLGLTQPALTIQVRAIEQLYGVRLFDRIGRAIALTEVGRSLFEVSRRLFSLEEEAQELLTDSRELRGGRLRVAADGPHIVMGMFARFMQRYPDVRLSVNLGNTRFVRQELLDRRVDIGILPGLEGTDDFFSVPLWRHSAVLIVPLDHPWAQRRSIHIAELDGQPMLMREDGSNTQRKLEAALKRAGVRPKVVLELGSREGVLGAVAAGLGFGVVWKMEASGDARFRMLEISDSDMQSMDYVACRKSERNRRVVRAMMAIAEAVHTTGTTVTNFRRAKVAKSGDDRHA